MRIVLEVRGGAVYAINTNGGGFTNLYNLPLGGASIGQNPAAGVTLVPSQRHGK